MDTKGKAKLVVDSERLEIDTFKAIGGKVNGSDIENNIELNLKMITLIDSYEFDLDKKSDLSNGDIVTIEATINDEVAKANNLVLKFRSEKVALISMLYISLLSKWLKL